MKKAYLVICLALLILCCSFMACSDNNKNLSAEEEQALIEKANIGDFVQFGQYEQDNDISNGKEKIEWIVLDKKDSRALLISRYILDCKAHYANDTYTGQMEKWSKSLIRTWLNSQFYNQAFSSDEQSYITTTRINDIESGNVSDKIFLLSSSEISTLFLTANERKTTATAFAKAQGVDTNWWWTRSKPSSGTDTALKLRFVFVSPNGTLDTNAYSGCIGGYEELGIRPALWISLN